MYENTMQKIVFRFTYEVSKRNKLLFSSVGEIQIIEVKSADVKQLIEK